MKTIEEKTLLSPQSQQSLLEELENTKRKLSLTEDLLHKTTQQLQDAHRKVAMSDEPFKKMLQSMPFVIHIWSKDRVMLDASLMAANILGYESTQDFLANFEKSLPKFQPKGGHSFTLALAYLEKAQETGYLQIEWTHLHCEGEAIPFEATLIPSIVHGEQVIFVFLRDLRKQNAIIQKLHESHEYSRIMLDASPVGAMIWDNMGNPVGCNIAMYTGFGFTNHEDFMKNMHKLYPEYQPDGSNSLQKMQEQLQNAFIHGHAEAPWMGTSIDGKEVPTAATAVRTKHNGQDMVVVFYQDLREVEKNIKKAHKAEKRTEAILNGVPMGINIMTPDAKIVDANEEAVRISRFGNKEDFIANVMQSFPPTQPNGQRSDLFIQDHFIQAAQKGKSRFELLAIDANQELYFLDTTLVRAHLEHEDLYIAYCNDLRETKSMLKEIELSKEAAEQSAQAKSDFLANMSHEIRTPMNGILGLLRILSGTKLDKEQQGYMQKALFSTHELLRIINDILDFSKIEAGKLEMENTTFTIHDICSELESLFGHTLREKGLSYEMEEGSHATTPILGDPLRLKQVLLNLINNAIKFTSQGQISLHISSTLQENKSIQYLFKVSDTGIGLSQGQIQNLFSAFTQADTSVTRKYGGTGLGLAICKNIVTLLKGRIWVESTPDQGSTFFFTANFEQSQDQNFARSASTLTQNYKAQGEHILLVEDNQINQIIAEELLQSVGYTVDIANNGQEAIHMLQKTKYDMVLMDIQMPIMDGLTAVKTLRQMPQFATLPIVAMSAHAMIGDKEKSLQHGMNDHITKPISPDILFSTMRHWFDQGKA